MVRHFVRPCASYYLHGGIYLKGNERVEPLLIVPNMRLLKTYWRNLIFDWWVPFTLKKRDHSKANIRFIKKSHKFGVKLPHNIQEAHTFDVENGNTLWRDTIQKEIFNVSIAFDILDLDEHAQVGYGYVGTNLIFDVKMDFTRKARLIAGGHMTDLPENQYTMVYYPDKFIGLQCRLLH